MPHIIAYGCTSAAGKDTRAFWDALVSGMRPERLDAASSSREGAREALCGGLMAAWHETRAKLEKTASATLDRVRTGRTLGVILASTKGDVEDWVWRDTSAPGGDPLAPVLDEFLRQAELHPVRSVCMANACASSAAALGLARLWIEQSRAQDVLILAADQAGPFVRKGFQALGALARDMTRPFSADRSGLELGEASAAILVSRDPAPGSIELRGVGLDTEGFAATRPSTSGDSLRRACVRAMGADALMRPDLVIAHGTATRANDEVEDRVLRELFGRGSVPVTATKWRVGHTLGASAALDVIAACEALTHQRAFHIATTPAADPAFGARYLTAGSELPAGPLASALVTSLGFGGVHAAVWLAPSNPATHAAVAAPRAPAPAPAKPAPTVARATVREASHLVAPLSPGAAPPEWAPRVDRWNQLDAAAHALVEGTWRERGSELPTWILLASAGASNETDLHFARTGAVSPARFTHTLPNVRGTALCQALGWSGPMLCLQRDPSTWEHAVEEAEALVLASPGERVWVVGAAPSAGGTQVRIAKYAAIPPTASASPTEVPRNVP